MLRLAYLLTGSVESAEDAVQDAFLGMHGLVATVENPGAYLRTSVVNRCRSHHRRRAVADRWLQRQAASSRVELPPELDETWRALQALPDRQREVLVLRFYLDLPLAEIGQLLAIPVATVKSHLRRGLMALKKEVER